jgi:hypothetical protein
MAVELLRAEWFEGRLLSISFSWWAKNSKVRRDTIICVHAKQLSQACQGCVDGVIPSSYQVVDA